MNIIYQELADRIRGTAEDLDRVVERTLRAWPRAQKPSDDQEAYLDSVALNLHGFYSGLERLFEMFARRVDDSIPSREVVWHRELLFHMAKEIQNVRPAVISQDHAGSPDEYRRFSHLVRNIYTMNLLPDRMSRLVSALPEPWPDLRAELLAFADFTEGLASQ